MPNEKAAKSFRSLYGECNSHERRSVLFPNDGKGLPGILGRDLLTEQFESSGEHRVPTGRKVLRRGEEHEMWRYTDMLEA